MVEPYEIWELRAAQAHLTAEGSSDKETRRALEAYAGECEARAIDALDAARARVMLLAAL